MFVYLTPVAIVHGVRFRQALTQSVRLVWKHYLTALALAVGAGLLCFVVVLSGDYLRALTRGDFAVVSLLALGLLPTVIAVWGVLALFVWYREATAVAPGVDEVGPAEE